MFLLLVAAFYSGIFAVFWTACRRSCNQAGAPYAMMGDSRLKFNNFFFCLCLSIEYTVRVAVCAFCSVFLMCVCSVNLWVRCIPRYFIECVGVIVCCSIFKWSNILLFVVFLVKTIRSDFSRLMFIAHLSKYGSIFVRCILRCLLATAAWKE